MVIKKIPVKIICITDQNNNENIEISMGLNDFESSGKSISENIKEFKINYLEAIHSIKNIQINSKTKKVSVIKRWKVCKILSDLNYKLSNKFFITNYKEAYARDFNISIRSIRAYLDFGSNFSENEIKNDIPFSIYAELLFRINQLKAKNMFESEKSHLIQLYEKNNIPDRNTYRENLKQRINM